MIAGDGLGPVERVDDAARVDRVADAVVEIVGELLPREPALRHAGEQDAGGEVRPQRKVGITDQVDAELPAGAGVVVAAGDLHKSPAPVAPAVVGFRVAEAPAIDPIGESARVAHIRRGRFLAWEAGRPDGADAGRAHVIEVLDDRLHRAAGLVEGGGEGVGEMRARQGAAGRQHGLEAIHLVLRQAPAERGRAHGREERGAIDAHNALRVWMDGRREPPLAPRAPRRTAPSSDRTPHAARRLPRTAPRSGGSERHPPAQHNRIRWVRSAKIVTRARRCRSIYLSIHSQEWTAICS